MDAGSPMDLQRALQLIDRLLAQQLQPQGGGSLTDLQRAIIQGVWQGQRYGQIAAGTQYSEGHIKDVSADLWQSLGQALGERVSKGTLRSVLQRHQERLAGDGAIDPTQDLEADLGLSSGWIGRVEALAHLEQRRQQVRGVVIWGEGGAGKTRLAQTYLHSGRFDRVLQVLMAKDPQGVTPVESLVAEWLQQDLGEEPVADLGICLSRLRRQLQRSQVGILIDNLEPALDRQGRFWPHCQRYRELLRVLWDPTVRSFTLITSRDRLCEPDITVEHYRLPGLELQEWRQYFQAQGIRGQSECLEQIHQLNRGNAKAMGILCGVVAEECDGDLDLYWRTLGEAPLATPDLKNLVAEQFNRLHDLDPVAYLLLCRLGCLRYQQIPRVDAEIMGYLLWDHPDVDLKQLITSLRQRSILEGSGGYYSLHPLIRAEAISRLKQGSEWIRCHRQAALAWTERITAITDLKDALQAWEAFYHYQDIGDHAGAAQVILKARHNQWGQYLSLGGALYRLGFSYQVRQGIQAVLQHQDSGEHLSELYNLLADQDWISGQLHSALGHQTHALQLALQRLSDLDGETDLESDPEAAAPQEARRYYFQMLSLDSRLSLGLYALDLWELGQARDRFEAVIHTLDRHLIDPRHRRWGQKAMVGLALIDAIEGREENARQRLEPILDLLQTIPVHHTGHLAYFIHLIGQTYGYLQAWDRAEDVFQQTLQIALSGHYLQIQAKALTGLARVHRARGSLSTAMDDHHQAIQLLQQIGARCDLAEAYVQQGLTLQQISGQDPLPSWDQALGIYHQMQAPQQIERIQALQQSRSM